MKTVKPAEAKTPLSRKKVNKLKESLRNQDKPSKNPTKVSTKDTDVNNIKDTVKKTVEQTREVKYIYPANVKTNDEKKKYRQTTRNKDKAFLKDIADAEKKKLPVNKIKAKYKEFRKEHFLVP